MRSPAPNHSAYGELIVRVIHTQVGKEQGMASLSGPETPVITSEVIDPIMFRPDVKADTNHHAPIHDR